jgi:hypothetical protein
MTLASHRHCFSAETPGKSLAINLHAAFSLSSSTSLSGLVRMRHVPHLSNNCAPAAPKCVKTARQGNHHVGRQSRMAKSSACERDRATFLSQLPDCHAGPLRWAVPRDGGPWLPPSDLMASVNGAILLHSEWSNREHDNEISLLAIAID